MQPKNQTKRVIVVYWKTKSQHLIEVFSSLKNFCLSYKEYNYNTLSNYLSKGKVPYENDEVRVERKFVFMKPKMSDTGIERKIIPVVRKIALKQAEDYKHDLTYWLTKPPSKRLAAVTLLIRQSLKKGQRMDKTKIIKKKIEAMMLEKDFEDFLKLLNKHQVEYMVVGGYALALHGRPRHTGDLDIWINISEDNAIKLLRVIHEFGMASLDLKKEDFIKPGYISQIGYPPLRIDILNSIDGVEFREAVGDMQKMQIENNFTINYIGLTDFLKNKQASGRKQDIADIREIKKLQATKESPKKRKGKRL